ncbi:MAG: retropepsin-like aspartic protease [Cyanobacteriota bacterium]|nr:retropepsin-like aspartic protease [Cyanobacteriota bacterium]
MAVIIAKKKVGNNEATFNKLSLWRIPVTIKGLEKAIAYNLLLDTGAQRTVIRPYLAEEVGIQLEEGSKSGVGIGGKSTYRIGNVDLEIASITLGSLNVLVGPLPGPFSKYNIDGLLGADALKMLKVELDYPGRTLEISKTIVLP